MPANLCIALALAASLVGIAWIALAMAAHWRQARGSATPPAPRSALALRVLGGAALAASLVLCLHADHASIAVLVWIMSLAAAAMAVALVLAWKPRWLGWLTTPFR